MAQLAVGITLHELATIALQEISPIHQKLKLNKVKDQIEEIRLELTRMKSFLTDADERQSKEERVRHWVREIKALAYRIEDVIETFVIRVESTDVKRIKEKRIKRFLRNSVLSYLVVAVDVEAIESDINEIKSKLHSLSQSSSTYGIIGVQSLDTSVDGESSRKTSPSNNTEGEEHLVGMEEDIQWLVSSILDESKNYQVISICGMVGIGKTSLASKLWHTVQKCERFEYFAWVHITQKLSPRAKYCQDILREFFKDQEQRKAIKDMDDTELANHLYDSLQKKRCLIVLDNVLSKDALERLRIAFPSGKTGSKIIITTRSLEVAELATADEGLIHTMSCLSEDEAWQLFIQSVTRRDGPEVNAVDSEMENIGREIVRRCKGLPLGIVALGEKFRTKSTLQKWKTARENNEVLEGIDKVLQSLTSIYVELPYQLKSCLLYLATFRKNTEIKSEKLYHLWMAEGLVSSDNYQSETLMHVAERHLKELHLRCMVYVQEEEIPTAGKFKSCSLHDLMHDFCLLKGREEEFLMVMKNEPEQISGSSSWTDKVRVVLYVGSHNNSTFLDRLTKNLRFLLVRNAGENQELVPDEMLSKLIDHILQLRFLRILDFDRINFGRRMLPEEKIADLVHLRYVSFMGCLLKKLPASLGYLPYLQILDLRVEIECEIEIPNVLRNMKRLRHLYLPLKFRTRGGVKLRLDGLTQLETLENFNTEVCDAKDLFTLTKIWYLTTNTEGSLQAIEMMISLMNRPSEHELRLSVDVRNFDCYADERHSVFRKLIACPTLHVLYMEGHLGQIPPYRKISKNLAKIVLSGSELQIDPMPTLEKLPSLRVLILLDDAFVGKEMICSASQFPELKRLELSNLYDLESWRVEEKAMPNLSTLKIENCSQLKKLPDGLRFLENLQELVLSGSELQFDQMPSLEKIPKLQVLILIDNAFVGKEIICSASTFPELKRLELSNLCNLESWKVEEKAMPKLSTLVIENCSKLKMLPDGLQFLINLRELKILRMPIAFENRLRMVNGVRGEDMDKVPLNCIHNII